MSKFNGSGHKAARKTGPASPMTTVATTETYEGGNAFVRDQKTELYMLAVVNMVGENTFYEDAQKRDDRFAGLVRSVALVDPCWLYRFVGWLRNKANMRSASIVVAAEAIHARLEAGATLGQEYVREYDGIKVRVFNKDFIPQSMARADEPGEFLAYWTAKYGKNLPMPVKRGLALAANDLYNEYSYAKYGKSDSSAFQMADVVELVHPAGKDQAQSDLYRHAINERHKRDEAIPETLPMLRNRAEVMAIPQDKREAFLKGGRAMAAFQEAGLTWEAASGWLGKALDASFWETLIPNMGYMALLRNLRNFEKAGISKAARKVVQERLSDPAQVAKSRQFPYRFLSAYRAVESDMWGEALSDALDASIGNLPVFPGKTLVMVDTSGSMQAKVSDKSQVSCLDVGALFGVAFARAGGEVNLWGFADSAFEHKLPQGGSALKGIQSFTRRVGEVGYGTQTVASLKQAYDGHDRVILVTDMQAFAHPGYGYGYSRSSVSVTEAVPADVMMYGINPVGYGSTALDLSKRNRYEIGGFSDQVFRMMSLLEAGNANWPF